MKTKRTEIRFLTELRALACIAIVLLHTFYAASAAAPTTSALTAALTVRNLMLWAVPCFVMISGALLLDPARQVSYRKLFQKYILRIVLALLLFSVLFQIYDDATEIRSFSFTTILKGLENAVTGQSWNHMWYLYLILALYLMLPFYRKIAAAMTRKDTLYLLIVYLVFLSLLPTLQTLTEKSIAFYICTYSVYPLYFFLGHAFYQNKLYSGRLCMGLLTGGGTVIMAGLTILSTMQSISNLSAALTSYAFPLIVLQSAGIFGWMFRSTAPPRWISWILRQIDGCSFGIYLVHMIFLKLIFVTLSWNPYQHGGFGMILLVALGVFLCSFGMIWLLKRIPGVRRIF